MEEKTAVQTISTIGIFCITFLFVYFWIKYKGIPRMLPPGPRCLPIVGYYPFLTNEPHLALAKLKDKYGPVFGLMIGTRYCVVLSNFRSIKESYNKPAFLGRPPNYFRVSVEHSSISDMNGTDWDEQRKFSINTLRALGMGKNRLEEIFLDEISRLIPKLRSTCEENNLVNMREAITPAINNAIFQLICNRWFEDNHPIMKTLVLFQNSAPESFLNTSPVIYFPWLKWLLLKFDSRLKEIWKAIEEMEAYMKLEISTHEENYSYGNPGDYIDYFLTEMYAAREGSTFTREILTTNAIFLLQAGSETVRNTLEWSFMCMAKFSRIQEKVYNEITSALGQTRIPTWEDKIKLPFTEAVIYETERWKTLVVLNCLRWTTEDAKLQHFHIPKGTIIINNLWACHMDPEYWDEPEDFRPERFLSKDGTKAVIPEYFMPFSLGKRDCPGDKMAIMEVFLYFTALMQTFKFSEPEGGVCFDHFVGINVHAKKPFTKVTLR